MFFTVLKGQQENYCRNRNTGQQKDKTPIPEQEEKAGSGKHNGNSRTQSSTIYHQNSSRSNIKPIPYHIENRLHPSGSFNSK
jgi:hypothetical protein